MWTDIHKVANSRFSQLFERAANGNAGVDRFTESAIQWVPGLFAGG